MKNKSITFKTIFNLILSQRPALIWGQLITLLAIAVSIPIPLMLPVMVDEVLLNKPSFIVNTIDDFFGTGDVFYYIAIATAVVIFLRVFHFLLNAVITKIFTSIAKFVTFEIRKKLLTHLQKVCMNEYETLGSGAISSNLVTDVNTLDSFIITSASKFISSVLTLFAVSIVIILIHPILGIMIIVIQPLIMFLSKKIARYTGSLKKDENQAIEEFQNNLGETLELFGQIKASNKEQYFFDESISKAHNIQKTSNEYSYKSVAYERFSFTIFLVAFELLRASGLLMVAYSDLSIGMMFAMFGYIWFMMTPVQNILSMQYTYASAKSALKRINKILELTVENNGEVTLDKIKELDITLENVSFSYNADKIILDNISLEIKAKQHIALIGASGSGKTTLAQVVAVFYEKDTGIIKYNNEEIESIDRSSLRNNIFLVLQMPILFNNTLRFNITMGNENISDAEIYRALEIAQFKDVVLDMKDGLDTIVGRHGIRLSGGQRQRISIARMIIADPSVVIFDESTSALDVHTETKLFKALEPILKDKTVITIAHRLSTVQNADTIYVLDGGKIVEQGSHDELEDQDGHYNQFIKNQLI
ncbi:ABC transporter ATP-binding protein [Arcobacter sp. 15-2]|uniref:ABC transporter ATP-binding protein n=1 Tax=Arcobacter sp. 15-2 TaxID=3374109 RepID=UPI00399C644D